MEARIGYVFKDKGLLAQALTHSSAGARNYERLEFLGDRVLGVVVANWLLESFADAPEGELSRRHMALVRESALVTVAEGWGVPAQIVLGPGEGVKPSIVGDVVEAILGAVWLESGLDAVTAIVKRDWAPMIEGSEAKDPKTRLQELVQGKGGALPAYDVVAEDGPAHDRVFVVNVSTILGAAAGTGRSKQAAGTEAAKELLKRLDDKND